jgi:hypothetical protein
MYQRTHNVTATAAATTTAANSATSNALHAQEEHMELALTAMRTAPQRYPDLKQLCVYHRCV